MSEKFVELTPPICRVPCGHDEATTRCGLKSEVVLSEAEREQLAAFTLRRKTAQALALRRGSFWRAPTARTTRSWPASSE